MKILLLSRYSSLGASSRLRSYQYLPYLQEAGWEVDVSPLFGDEYLEAFYQNQSKFLQALLGYLKRILTLTKVRRYDLVWIEKELFPFLPAFFEVFLDWLQVPYLVDYDDALFHRYDQHNNGLIRFLLGKKIKRVIRHAGWVTAGNKYLADYAHSAGARQISLIPTVVDLRKYAVKEHRPGQPVRVVWIGSPATDHYLLLLEEAIENLTRQGKVIIIAIGGSSDDLENLPIEVWQWSEKDEAQLLKRCDIGIMPLEDNLWERGKCGYKLIQYMACGLPVVASPVGVNNYLVRQNKNGLLAEDGSAWVESISRLAESWELRREMGLRGRNLVEQEYSLDIQLPKLKAILESLLTTAVEGGREA